MVNTKDLEQVVWQIYGSKMTDQEAVKLLPSPDYMNFVFNYIWRCPKCEYWLPTDYNHEKQGKICCVCAGCCKSYPNFVRS